MKIETLIELIYCNKDHRINIRAKHLAKRYLRLRMYAERISYVSELNKWNGPYLSTYYPGFGDATYHAILSTLGKLNRNNINTGFPVR